MTFADRLLNAISRSGYSLDDATVLTDGLLAKVMAEEGVLTSVRRLRGFGSLEPWNPLAYAARHALSGEGQWGALSDLLEKATPPLRMDEVAGVPAGTTTLGFIGLALLAEWGALGTAVGHHRSCRIQVLQFCPEEKLWPLAFDTADTLMADPDLPKRLGLRVVDACWEGVKRFASQPLCAPDLRDTLMRRLIKAPWVFHGMYPYQKEGAREWMAQHPVAFAASLAQEQPPPKPRATRHRL